MSVPETISRTIKRIGMILLLCSVVVISGCATSQKINIDVLEACKTKIFKLGVIKAAGSSDFPFTGCRLVSKKKALDRIPIDNLCSTLKKAYGLSIDTNIDRAPRVVKERAGSGAAPHPPSGRTGLFINLQPTTENAYYGNLEYDNASTFWLMFGGKSKVSNKERVPDILNLTYSMEQKLFGLKTRFLYSILIKSSGQDVLELKGIVGTISTPTKRLIVDQDVLWEEYVKYAERINDALMRDLAEASKS